MKRSHMINNCFRNTMIYHIIVSARGDVNGDGIPDNVFLTGTKTPGSKFIQNIILVARDKMTGRLIRIALSDNAGYNPTL